MTLLLRLIQAFSFMVLIACVAFFFFGGSFQAIIVFVTTLLYVVAIETAIKAKKVNSSMTSASFKFYVLASVLGGLGYAYAAYELGTIGNKDLVTGISTGFSYALFIPVIIFAVVSSCLMISFGHSTQRSGTFLNKK